MTKDIVKEDLQEKENFSPATQVNNNNDKLSNQNKPLREVLFIIAEVAILSATFYAGMKFSAKKEIAKPPVSETNEQFIPTPTIMPSESDEEISIPSVPLKPNAISPSIFGFTKTIDLPGMGVSELLFPKTPKLVTLTQKPIIQQIYQTAR